MVTYPSPGWDALEAEVNEVSDEVHIIIRDAAGAVANRVKGGTSKGFHRVSWNLTYASKAPITPGQSQGGGNGFLATPGEYSATLMRVADGAETKLGGPHHLYCGAT